jgi:hypothetical protein
MSIVKAVITLYMDDEIPMQRLNCQLCSESEKLSLTQIKKPEINEHYEITYKEGSKLVTKGLTVHEDNVYFIDKTLKSEHIAKIHINQHHIRHNINCEPEERKPVITVKIGSKNTYAEEVQINGSSTVVYRPDSPLSCGAKVWIEALEYDLILVNPTTYKEIKDAENK